MSGVFTDPRFGDGTRPSPYNYSLYLRDFYWLQYPTANSANSAMVAFSGQSNQPPGSQATPDCDYQTLAADVAQRGQTFQSLWLVGYDIVAMRRDRERIVVEVQPSANTFEDVVFPYPPAADFEAPAVIDIVQASGVQLFEQDAEGNAWQADATGTLVFAWATGSGSPLAAIPTGAPSQAAKWDLFADSERTPAGQVTGFDVNGNELTKAAWQAATAAWQPLGVIASQEGLRKVVLEAAGQGGVLIARGDVQLP